MKRSNIILSTIGLLSVISGIWAFKAQSRFGGLLRCYTTVNQKALIKSVYTISNDPSSAHLVCGITFVPTKYSLMTVTLNN